MPRKMRVTRNKNGSYKNFPGGEDTTYHGAMIKFGKEFKRQHGRVAKPGDAVRRKNKDGSYNKGSIWQIRTPNGWRRSPTKYKKPTKSQINQLCKKSRKGR